MLRSGQNLLRRAVVAVGVDLIPSESAVCVQQTRGLRPRKPAYTGIAKSKLFRIPKRPDLPPDELAEIRRISNQYRLFMRSISNFCKLENQSHAAGSRQAEKEIDAEEAEWKESLLKIKQWNEEVATKRNTRLLEQKQDKETLIKERILQEELQQLKRLEEIDDIVRKEKELSKTYITPENIDKAIEEALENKLDFNYALDTRGNKYVGRYVNASGTEDLPETGEVDDEQLPPLFQSSPIVSQSTSGK